MGTCMVLHGVLCDISLVLDSEKTKHNNMLSVKFSLQSFICNYEQMYLIMYSDSQ